MLQVTRDRWSAMLVVAGMVSVVGGCTGPLEYVRNGFKVGPNYSPAPVPVAAHYIDVADAQLRSESPDLSHWWCVFNDPTLDQPDCRGLSAEPHAAAGGVPILEARAQLAIARGELFPQTQTSNGSYTRAANHAPSAVPGRGRRSTRAPGTWASICNGNSTSGGVSAGRSPPRTPISTQAWLATTRRWSPCSATSSRTMCRFAPTRSGSPCCATA